MSNTNFLKAVIKDHRVGAFTASSKYVVQKIIQQLKPEHRFIIEYGAGDGVITKAILDFLPRSGRLAAVELNRDFFAELEKIKDGRLSLVNGDVFRVLKDLLKSDVKADAVISGIPFTWISGPAREKIISQTSKAVRDGGIFIVYQYTPLVLPLLKKYFRKVHIIFEPRNFFPYFIMVAEK